MSIAGDQLDPDRVTALLGVEPTTGYRKGEVFKRSRGHEVRGRTGLWLLSTRRQLSSTDLNDHLAHLLEALYPAGSARLIEPLRALMDADGLEADIGCFWYGERGAAPPEIPEATRAAFARIGATIDTDFDTD